MGYDTAMEPWKKMYDVMESRMNVSKVNNQELKIRLEDEIAVKVATQHEVRKLE